MANEYGYAGNILKVDLSKESLVVVPTIELADRFVGGRGFAAKIYWDGASPEVKACDPQNRLIFVNGPLAGFHGLAGSRWQVCGKSPAVIPECFSYANFGGSWGAWLKFAGYDAVVIEGASDKPVYLVIQDGKTEIKDASFLWGKGALATRALLKGTHGEGIRVATMGPAGDNLAVMANIIAEDDSSGSGGFGAVMGAKKLKAIAVGAGERKVTAANPEKLHELQRLWLIEAVRYNVLPLDDRFAERGNPGLAGRPELLKGNRQLLFGGMSRLTEGSILNTKNKSYAITAEVVVPESGAEGVIIALGGTTGGWSLYAKDGKPKYCYNFYGIQRTYIEGQKEIPAGQHQVRMEFDYDGGGLAKGGLATLYLDGEKIGEGRVEHTEPILFSADETCDLGYEAGSPVSEDYGPRGNEFTGEVNWVEIDLGEDAQDADHYIDPEERLRVYMAIQ